MWEECRIGLMELEIPVWQMKGRDPIAISMESFTKTEHIVAEESVVEREAGVVSAPESTSIVKNKNRDLKADSVGVAVAVAQIHRAIVEPLSVNEYYVECSCGWTLVSPVESYSVAKEYIDDHMDSGVEG